MVETGGMQDSESGRVRSCFQRLPVTMLAIGSKKRYRVRSTVFRTGGLTARKEVGAHQGYLDHVGMIDTVEAKHLYFLISSTSCATNRYRLYNGLLHPRTYE